MPKKARTRSPAHKCEQGRRTASSSAASSTAMILLTATEATNKRRKHPPAATGSSTATKATTKRRKDPPALLAPEIPKNFVEVWRVPVLRAKLLKILQKRKQLLHQMDTWNQQQQQQQRHLAHHQWKDQTDQMDQKDQTDWMGQQRTKTIVRLFHCSQGQQGSRMVT